MILEHCYTSQTQTQSDIKIVQFHGLRSEDSRKFMGSCVSQEWDKKKKKTSLFTSVFYSEWLLPSLASLFPVEV